MVGTFRSRAIGGSLAALALVTLTACGGAASASSTPPPLVSIPAKGTSDVGAVNVGTLTYTEADTRTTLTLHLNRTMKSMRVWGSPDAQELAACGTSDSARSRTLWAIGDIEMQYQAPFSATRLILPQIVRAPTSRPAASQVSLCLQRDDGLWTEQGSTYKMEANTAIRIPVHILVTMKDDHTKFSPDDVSSTVFQLDPSTTPGGQYSGPSAVTCTDGRRGLQLFASEPQSTCTKI